MPRSTLVERRCADCGNIKLVTARAYQVARRPIRCAACSQKANARRNGISLSKFVQPGVKGHAR